MALSIDYSSGLSMVADSGGVVQDPNPTLEKKPNPDLTVKKAPHPDLNPTQ